nr:DUF2809 domain-containing protein [Bacteroidota bacterium]
MNKNKKSLASTFNKQYFIAAIAILFVEVLIALFVHDKIVRPYIGDALVVVLIYCFVKSFFPLPVLPTAIAVLLFAFFVEAMQYFHFINLIGLEYSAAAKIIIGNSFSKLDLVAYTVGVLLVLLVEMLRQSMQ